VDYWIVRTMRRDEVVAQKMPRLSSQRPSVVTMAAKNKCLAQMNKSGTPGTATKKARNPASRLIRWVQIIALCL